MGLLVKILIVMGGEGNQLNPVKFLLGVFGGVGCPKKGGKVYPHRQANPSVLMRTFWFFVHEREDRKGGFTLFGGKGVPPPPSKFLCIDEDFLVFCARVGGP